MACKRCDFKGFIETYYHYGAKSRPQVRQCFDCNDIKAYTKRVQEVLGIIEPADLSEDEDRASDYILGSRENVDRVYFGGRIFQNPTTSDIKTREGKPCPVIPFKRS